MVVAELGLEELIRALERVHRGEYADTLAWSRRLAETLKRRAQYGPPLTRAEQKSVAGAEGRLRLALADYETEEKR